MAGLEHGLAYMQQHIKFCEDEIYETKAWLSTLVRERQSYNDKSKLLFWLGIGCGIILAIVSWVMGSMIYVKSKGGEVIFDNNGGASNFVILGMAFPIVAALTGLILFMYSSYKSLKKANIVYDRITKTMMPYEKAYNEGVAYVKRLEKDHAKTVAEYELNKLALEEEAEHFDDNTIDISELLEMKQK